MWAARALAGLAVVVALAVSFETGLYRGHREGMRYAERRQANVAYCVGVLEDARQAFGTCESFATYLHDLPTTLTRKERRLVERQKATGVCVNCGGEP